MAVSGRLCTIGRAPLGQFAAKIGMVERALGLSRHHIASFVDNKSDGISGGGRFSSSLLQMVVLKIQGHILSGGKNISPQWPRLSTEYGDLKTDYASGFGQYRLTAALCNAVSVQKRWGESSRSVGVYKNPFVPKISFGVMRGNKPKKTIRIGDYHYWNEFGRSESTGGRQPSRPLFGPSFKEIGYKYLPKLGAAVASAIESDYKRLKVKLTIVAGPMFPVGGAVSDEFLGPMGVELGQYWKDDDMAKEDKKLKASDPEMAAAWAAFGNPKLEGIK